MSIFGQEAYLGFGPNQTEYLYTNTQGESYEGLKGEGGIHLEGGYYLKTGYDNLKLAFSLTFDQFNATGGDELNSYSWESGYMGLQGGVRFGIIEGVRGSDFALFANGGVTAKKLLTGVQKINGQTFELSEEAEFNGLFKGIYFGLETRFNITQEVALGLGYAHSINYGRTINEETLNFSSGAIVFKILTAFY
tara:strand:+ start:58 stop:636 length:579 start_codon:yes stop_codon:yes gene_type:complete